jgi:hypothetical protein
MPDSRPRSEGQFELHNPIRAGEAVADRTALAAPLRAVLREPWLLAVATTTLLAATVATAPLTGLLAILAAALLWAVAVTYFVISSLFTRARHWTIWHWVFVAGVSAALLRAVSLGLVQLLRNRPALFWNVDARYWATLANGVARFAGLDNSLEYAGSAVGYHAGQAWIAGALQRTFGVPANFSLFLLIPTLATVVAAVAAYRLLRQLGAPQVPSLVSVAIAVNVPAKFTDVSHVAHQLLLGHADALNDPQIWFLSATSLMLSALWWAIGFTAGSTILGARTWKGTTVGLMALASLFAIKPQYFVGFGLLITVAWIIQVRQRRRPIPWRQIALAGAVTMLVAAFVYLVNPSDLRTTGVSLHLVTALRNLVHPGRIAFLAPFPFYSACVTIVLLALVPALRRTQPRSLVTTSVAIVGAAFCLLIALEATTFNVDATQLARANSVGFGQSVGWLDLDLNQALVPVTLVLFVVASAQIVIVFQKARGPWLLVPGVVALVFLVATLPATFSGLRHPTGRSAHEWAEEAGLKMLLDRVETDRGVWLSSDLADSAEDFYRPLRMVNVTALSDAQFYVSNLEYLGWSQPDIAQRVHDVQRFFTTPWSAWHQRFIRDHDVRHVIVRDRCPPIWDQNDFPGRVVGRAGGWTLLEVTGRKGSTSTTERLWPGYHPQPQYGRSSCLSASQSPSG